MGMGARLASPCLHVPEEALSVNLKLAKIKLLKGTGLWDHPIYHAAQRRALDDPQAMFSAFGFRVVLGQAP